MNLTLFIVFVPYNLSVLHGRVFMLQHSNNEAVLQGSLMSQEADTDFLLTSFHLLRLKFFANTHKFYQKVTQPRDFRFASMTFCFVY